MWCHMQTRFEPPVPCQNRCFVVVHGRACSALYPAPAVPFGLRGLPLDAAMQNNSAPLSPFPFTHKGGRLFTTGHAVRWPMGRPPTKSATAVSGFPSALASAAGVPRAVSTSGVFGFPLHLPFPLPLVTIRMSSCSLAVEVLHVFRSLLFPRSFTVEISAAALESLCDSSPLARSVSGAFGFPLHPSLPLPVACPDSMSRSSAPPRCAIH